MIAKKQAKFIDEQLRAEIDLDREEHDKKPLKNDDDNNTNGGSGGEKETSLKEQKESTTDPESGWLHKGEHKEVFAYSVQAGCDKNGWILGYSIHPGNEHDSQTFYDVYQKLKLFNPKEMVLDAGYKTPAIAKMLMDDNIKPMLPYKGPMTKDGFFKKYEYIYDKENDCYICPNDKVLKYTTTDRNGYREYKSNCKSCESCPYLSKCTNSKNHQELLLRHIWQDYLDICEVIRHTKGFKETYALRKETIERVFGTAKEHHGMRYTQEIGKKKMAMKVDLTFACMNMKKLAKLIDLRDKKYGDISRFSLRFPFLNPIFA